MTHNPLKSNEIMEEWRDIKGFEGLYQVSNLGHVKSVSRKIWNGKGFFRSKEKFVSQVLNHKGYLMVQLWSNKNFKTISVHRLVADAFVPNPKDLPQVNHKDEDKTNNKVSNLEWCTAKYNINYGTAKIRMAEKCSKPVIGSSLATQDCVRFVSAAEAGRNGFCASHVIECCNNKRKTHKGYIWNWQ